MIRSATATDSQALRRFGTAILFVLLPLACGEGEVGGGEDLDSSSVTPQSVAAPQVSFAVESFGAQADGQTDSTAAFQNAINAALGSAKPAEVVLAAGTYALSCPGTHSDPTKGDWCLWVSGAKNLTIRGQGSGATKVLVRNPLKGLLWSGSLAGLALKSFAVDYNPLPFTQGTVLSTSAATNSFDVQLAAGYPTLAGPAFSYQATSRGTAFGMIFEPGKPRLKDGLPSYFYGQSSTLVSGSTWRVTLDPGNAADLAKIVKGDRYVITARVSQVLVFWSGSEVALSDLAIHAGPGNATIFSTLGGTVSISGFKVQRKPGTDRLLSTGADALHLQDISGKVSITGCSINGMGDDAINIYTQGNPVTSVTSTSSLSVRAMAVSMAVGHTVQIVEPATRKVRGAAAIKSYALSADKTTATLVLDRAVSGLTVGDNLYDVSLGAPGAVITGNSFDSFRGSFRLRASGGSFTKNTILDAANARVLIDADAPSVNGQILWNEGPSLLGAVSALTVSNNSVSGGQLVLLDAANATVPVAAIGSVDGIGVYTSDGKTTVAGWACLKGLEVSVPVHVFVNGPYPSGTFIAAGTANVQREATVGTACGTATARHGYFVPLTAAVRAAHKGKKVYIHAIDEHGNPLLYNSGSFVVP